MIPGFYRSRSMRSNAQGFTLIEMAVVLVVMALILGSILVPLATQVEQRQVIDTRRQLEEIKDALIGYAIAQAAPLLPCPDTDNDGVENVNAGTGTCLDSEGNVPWATLGLAAVDPWNNRYRYRVAPTFAQRTPAATFTLTTADSTLRVCTSAACGQVLTVTPGLNAPIAMILSHGPNGWGAVNSTTGAINLPPGCGAVAGCATMNPDEIENANGDNNFVNGAPVTEDLTLTPPRFEYDDIVTWLSPHTLKHRLVAAGKLP